MISHASLAKVAVEAAAKVSKQLPVYTIGEGDGQLKLPTIEYVRATACWLGVPLHLSSSLTY